MKDRPILFNASMVRAILREIEMPGTGKTQTRRVIAGLEGGFDAIFCDDGIWHIGDALTGVYEQKLPVRYRVSDRLWVRESATRFDKGSCDQHVWYRAGANHETYAKLAGSRDGEWPHADGPAGGAPYNIPSIFLPRWASRITLIVTDVRVQRLQEITNSDCLAEGIDPEHVDRRGLSEARPLFHELWDSINAARGYGWDANPWVAAYTFHPILGNIDSIKEAA